MDNFDLRKYLTENKLTSNSKLLTLSEGKYDSFINRVSKVVFAKFKEQLPQALEDYKNGVVVSEEESAIDILEVVGKEGEELYGEPVTIADSSFEFWLNVKFDIGDTYETEGGAHNDSDPDSQINLIILEFTLPADVDLQKVSMDLKMLFRHELEHLLQGGSNERRGNKVKMDMDFFDKIESGELSLSDYLKKDFEVDAFIQGFYLKAKKQRVPFRQVFDEFMDTYNASQEKRDEIYKVWTDRAKELGINVTS